MRRLLIIALGLVMAACSTTDTRLAITQERPPATARVLVLQPDVQLSVLLAAGGVDPKADWSLSGRDNLSQEIQAVMATRSHPVTVIDVATAQNGRIGQVLRLHEAVGDSIRAFEYSALRLPTHRNGFDWTLGDGAQTIGQTYNADYALFTTARGTYSSSGRMAMFILAAAAGVSIPLGQQYVFTSLIDLHTGRVVWFNVVIAGPAADMRTPEGARLLVASVLEGVPL